MQIHEITKSSAQSLEEGLFGTAGAGIGRAVSGLKNVGSAIASPFKDVAQGYTAARQDQKVSAMADKAFRVWQNYVKQVEQSIAKQPAPVAQKKPAPAVGATTPGASAATTTATTAAADAKTATAQPTTPQYGKNLGATATYAQPTGVPNPLKQATPGVKQVTPGVTPVTPASTAPGQSITIGGQKLKPGTPEYENLAKMPIKQTESTLKELQAPVSPALAAFQARTDGKYEAYLRAFVQKNLLAGMGSRELVNGAEIDQAIKEISKPENADPVKQRPLWNDLVRAAGLAVPAARSLTNRDPNAPKDAPGATASDQSAQAEKTAAPAKPTMTKDQISQWISRNSEDHNALKAALDAINSAGKA